MNTKREKGVNTIRTHKKIALSIRGIIIELALAFCRVLRLVYSHKQCPLDRLLMDPYCLAPPKLGVGEFHADTDESSIEEAFRKHAGASSKVTCY